MTLTATDIRAIAVAVADELERRSHSGRTSPAGIGALEGEHQCDQTEGDEYMDPTSMDTAGDASSWQRMAREDFERLERGQRLRPTRTQRAARRTARR